MQQWEYLFLTIAYSGSDEGGIVKLVDGVKLEDNWKERNWRLADALAHFGGEGWELVTVVWREVESAIGTSFCDPQYIFKRPKS